MEASLYHHFILIWFALAVIVFCVLFFINAPYGRHTRRGWGPCLPDTLGWIFMEAPSVIFFAYLFFQSQVVKTIPLIFFFGLWQVHYLHRAFVYPFTIRSGRKKMSLIVILMGMVFNLGNTYLNGYYLFRLSGGYPVSWMGNPRFIIGIILFITGFIVNRWADNDLRSLREPGQNGYKIPRGGLYELVSCPNYLGEIIEWGGWAMATWSLSGLAFAVWTFANLAPRAQAHHAWYRKTYVDYPQQRKALFPGIW